MMKEMITRRFDGGRRDFLIAAAGLAALPLAGCASAKGSAAPDPRKAGPHQADARRPIK
jgi:hypothetical protein